MLERLSFLTMADRSYRISVVKKKGLLLEEKNIFSNYLNSLSTYLAPELAKSDTELSLN